MAEKSIRKGLKIDPEYSSLYLILSKLFLLKTELTTNEKDKIKYLKSSYQSIKNTIKLAPQNAYSYKIASDVLVKLSYYDNSPTNKLANALEYIEKALKIDPESKQFKIVKQSIIKKLTDN